MVNLLDLKYYLSCQKQVKDLATDPKYARQIKSWLDENPDVREELSGIYVMAVRTIENTQKP